MTKPSVSKPQLQLQSVGSRVCPHCHCDQHSFTCSVYQTLSLLPLRRLCFKRHLLLAKISRNENLSWDVGQSLLVCLQPTAHSSKASFTKLYKPVGNGLGKNRLSLQGHGVKGQGHANLEIFVSPRSLIYLIC